MRQFPITKTLRINNCGPNSLNAFQMQVDLEATWMTRVFTVGRSDFEGDNMILKGRLKMPYKLSTWKGKYEASVLLFFYYIYKIMNIFHIGARDRWVKYIQTQECDRR